MCLWMAKNAWHSLGIVQHVAYLDVRHIFPPCNLINGCWDVLVKERRHFSAVRCCIVVNCDQMSKVNSGLLSELMLRMEMYTEGSRSDIRCVRGLTQGS